MYCFRSRPCACACFLSADNLELDPADEVRDQAPHSPSAPLSLKVWVRASHLLAARSCPRVAHSCAFSVVSKRVPAQVGAGGGVLYAAVLSLGCGLGFSAQVRGSTLRAPVSCPISWSGSGGHRCNFGPRPSSLACAGGEGLGGARGRGCPPAHQVLPGRLRGVLVGRPSTPAWPRLSALPRAAPLLRQGVGARWGDGSTSRALGNREASRLAEIPPLLLVVMLGWTYGPQ